MKINIIVAYADNYVIGHDNKMPWYYKEDLEYFKRITTHVKDLTKQNVVIMGSKTYLSLPNPLKNRINIVITSNPSKFKNDPTHNQHSNLYFVDSLGNAMEICNDYYKNKLIEEVFIIGGAEIYKYYCTSFYIRYLNKVYITRIHRAIDGDKHFYKMTDSLFYISVKKSQLHEEIEYQVLQYDTTYKHPEETYYEKLSGMLKDENIVIHNQNSYYNSFDFNVKIDLTKSFPIFTPLKDKCRESINKMMIYLKNDKLIKLMEKIIHKESTYINLLDVEPFDSTYFFYESQKNLSCHVVQKKGNILADVLYNILFSSLLLHILSKLMNYKPYILKYECVTVFFNKKKESIVQNLILNELSILPILEIKDRNQQSITDFNTEDLILLGL